MAFSGDVEVFNEPGAVIKSAARDPQARPGVYERFAVPVREDIEGLQGGVDIDMSAAPLAQLDDLAAGAHFLVRTSNATFRVSLATLNQAIGGSRPILTKEDLGLAGDGVTDDAPALQRACTRWARDGGAVFMLRAQEGQAFYLNATIRSGSNVSIIFASPHKVGRFARLTLAGELSRSTDSEAPLLLAADTAAGDTTATIDTASAGGGNVASHLPVGSTIRFRGKLDGCGTPLEEHEARVTAATATTITFHPALAHSFKVSYEPGDYEAQTGEANVTVIDRIFIARASADVAAGANLFPIDPADLGNVFVGDHVLVVDEETCADNAGSSLALVNVEMRRIVEGVPGDATASVRLSARLERSYTTANNARLLKVEPIVNASIQGATVEFTEAPDNGSFVHPYEVRYGVDCGFSNPAIPNKDEFGTNGNGFRLYRSLACWIDSPMLRDAKFVDDGEGNGIVFAQGATDCWSRGGILDGARHAVQFFTATNCLAVDPVIENPRHTPLDFHGMGEVGCRVVNPTMTGGTTYEAIAGKAPMAISFGNPTFLNGPHRCGVEGGRVMGFKADSGSVEPCIWFVPGSTGCWVRDTEFHDISTLLGHEDVAGQGSLVSSGHRLVNVSVDGCADWLVNLDGRDNGASVDTLSDIKITGLVGRNLNKLMLVQFVTELELLRCDLDEITVDATRTYVLEADSCPNLTVVSNIFNGAGRGLRLTTCAGSRGFRVANNTFLDLANATTYRDEGGNSGEWVGNETCGFVESATIRGSVIKEGPRAAGVVTMADDTAFSFIPERSQGLVQVFSHNASTFYGVARYRAIASGNDCDLLDPTGLHSASVEVTTGALAGTTGTDAKFTISAHTNGRVYFENRLGSSVNVDFSTS